MKIKGKEYTEVSQRVKQFREEFKEYRLVTSIALIELDRVIFKAEVYDDKDRLVSTGYAEELKGNAVDENGKANINYDNYVEIAETSAVGRALGFLGIGINSGIASADEVSNAIEKQESRVEKTGYRKVRVEKFTKREPNDIWEKKDTIPFDFECGTAPYILKYNKDGKKFYWELSNKAKVNDGFPLSFSTELIETEG